MERDAGTSAIVRHRVIVGWAHVVHPFARLGSAQSCGLVGLDKVAASRTGRARGVRCLILTRKPVPLREVALFEIVAHPRDGFAGVDIRPPSPHMAERTPEMQISSMACSDPVFFIGAEPLGRVPGQWAAKPIAT